MATSGRALVISRRNLNSAREQLLKHQLQEEDIGSCRKCNLNNIDSQICKECINGGGKNPLFSPKLKKIKLRK